MKKKIMALVLATGFVSTSFAKVIPIVGIYQSTTTTGGEITVICALVSTRTCLKVLVPGGEGGPMYGVSVFSPDGTIIHEFSAKSYAENRSRTADGVEVNSVKFELP